MVGDSEGEPVIVEEREVHRGRLRVVRRILRHPNGAVRDYEIVNPGSRSVAAVALDAEGRVILVELYRFGQGRRLLELPAGGVEPGESPLDAMRRELLEETGYAGTLEAIGSHFIASEHGVVRHVFVARDCRRVAEPAPEPSEIDEGAYVRLVPLERFREIARRGELTETAAAFMALDRLGLL